jgi:hypothetical protein
MIRTIVTSGTATNNTITVTYFFLNFGILIVLQLIGRFSTELFVKFKKKYVTVMVLLVAVPEVTIVLIMGLNVVQDTTNKVKLLVA